MGQEAQLHVGGNTPRLLEEGQAPPPPPNDQPEELNVPHVYWTPDKAAQVVARICHAGSKFYGESIKAASWELDLIGDPAAAVLNDWIPLRVGATSDKTANLIALGVVVVILVLLRLPDILEVHGLLKPIGSKNKPKPAAGPPAAAAAPPESTGPVAFDQQLVGVNGNGASDDKQREQVFGATVVGSRGAIPEERT